MSIFQTFIIRFSSFTLTFFISASIISISWNENKKPVSLSRSEVKYLDVEVCEASSSRVKRDEKVYPDPFVLVVEISEKREIMINRQNFGNLDQLEQKVELIEILEEVFQNRLKNERVRNRYINIEKSIIVSANDKVTYGEFKKLVDVLNQFGASPIIIEMDKCCFCGGAGGSGA